jgi:hypothetical protein
MFTFFASSISEHSQTQSESQKPASVQPDSNYFPVGVFDENNQPSHKGVLYSYFLAAMDEPSLLEASQSSDILAYRFLRIWNARALSVRLVLYPDGTGMLGGKLVTLDSSKTVYAKDSVPVSKAEGGQFLALLQKADFWSMKTEEMPDKNHHRVDGAQWILEGTKIRSYHVVDRWSPRGTDYEQICRYLMELSPVKLDQDVRSTKGR